MCQLCRCMASSCMLKKEGNCITNSTGGKIFIGIEDKTNEVIGIGEKNPFRLADDISNMIFRGHINNIISLCYLYGWEWSPHRTFSL